MQNYTLSEQDIKVLIGAAGNAVCEDEIFPREFDGMIMKVSAGIAMKLLDHLSCENTFPKEERFSLRESQVLVHFIREK